MPTHNLPPSASDASRFIACGTRIAGTAVLVLSFFLFVLAAPPFAYGVWFKTEPVTVGLLGAGAAAAVFLVALDLTGHSVGLLLSRRHVPILLAFLAWNALVSAAHGFPGRSWFGTPETGEGIFSFLALAMLTLLAMTLWSYRVSRIVLVIAAVLAACTVAGLDGLMPWESAWRPERYAGYAGLVGPPVALIAIGAFRRIGWRTALFGLLCGSIPVAFSGNKTAIVLLCLAGPGAFFPARWLLRRVGVSRGRRFLAWLPVLAMVSTWAIIAGAIVYGDYDPLYSVRSRGLLILAEVLGLRDHPLALLTGFGWGSYNDVLYQHNYLPGVHGFVNGVWDPNWEGVGAGAFHVHDDIFEAILGGGLIGGILYLLFFISIVAGARRGMLAVGAVGWSLIVGSLCFWYPFMFCYPFLALAIAATTAPFGVLRSATPVPMDGWLRGAGMALAGILVAGCLMTQADAKAGGDRLAALNRQDPAEIASLGAFPPDHARGGVHLWWLALSEAAFIDQQIADGHPPTPAQAQWYARILQEVDAWTAAGRAGMRLEALTLALRNDLIANHERTALAALREHELPSWESAVLRVIGDAPDRTDVAVPYLAQLASRKDVARLTVVCARIEAIHPNDRVCRWYSGIAMLGDPATVPSAFRAMHKALAAHVETVAPVPNAARDMVEANVPGDTP
jgi:hypothetical protein